MLLECPGTGSNIVGEVWKIDQAKLEHLDILEEHPNFYTRKLDTIKVEGKDYTCWMYTMHNFKKELLENRMITEYSTNIIPYNPAYVEGKGSLNLVKLVKEV